MGPLQRAVRALLVLEPRPVRERLPRGRPQLQRVRVQSNLDADRNLYVVLYYTDRADPAAAYREYQQRAPSLEQFPDADRARKRIHQGMYVPSIGHYEYYD